MLDRGTGLRNLDVGTRFCFVQYLQVTILYHIAVPKYMPVRAHTSPGFE